MPHPPPLLEDQLCFSLYAANRAMTQAYQPLLKSLGLTYPQFLVMLVLWEDDDKTVSDIGERLMLDSGTLTPLLKRLEKAGHVERKRDPADERRVRIVLTPQGTELGLRAGPEHHAFACALANTNSSDAAPLREALFTLTSRLRESS